MPLQPLRYNRRPSHRQVAVLVAIATFPHGTPSRQQVADFLGVAREVVADAVRRLRRRGLLEPTGKLRLTALGRQVVLGTRCQPDLGGPTCNPYPTGVTPHQKGAQWSRVEAYATSKPPAAPAAPGA